MSKRNHKPAVCPFCASTQVTLAGEFARGGEPDRTFVQCKACGARGPYVAIDRKDDAAIAAVWEWNKRDG